MKDRLKVGGHALQDGIALRSARYVVVAKSVSDGCYELSEEKVQPLSAVVALIASVPILRGLLVPVMLFHSMRHSSKQVEGWDGMEEEQKILLWVFATIFSCLLFAPPIIIGVVFFPPGLVRNLFIFFPIFVPFLIAIFGRRSGHIMEMLRYHGAEHKIVNAYEKFGRPVTQATAILGSRFHPRCGTAFLTHFVLAMVACSLL
jgi:uncharacterized protein YqhQ